MRFAFPVVCTLLLTVALVACGKKADLDAPTGVENTYPRSYPYDPEKRK